MTDQVSEAVTNLYHAVNAMLLVVGRDGEIDSRHESTAAVMQALRAIDGGQYNPELQIQAAHPSRGVVDEVAVTRLAKHLGRRGGPLQSYNFDACLMKARDYLQAAHPAVPTFDMLAHLQRQREWSCRTFGPGPRTAGVIDHIRKELREIEADPTDLSEWIDVTILALDGAWRAGGTPEQIIATLVAKQTKNEGRTWPDWRTVSPDKAIEHDRTQDALPAVPSVPEDAADIAPDVLAVILREQVGHLHPVTQVFFRAGLIACREYMARFVEAESPSISASIRANWWPDLGPDLGPPRQIEWGELTDGEFGTDSFRVKQAVEVSPTLEALPIAFAFLQRATTPAHDQPEGSDNG